MLLNIGLGAICVALIRNVIELADADIGSWSEALEAMASVVFVVVALDMFFSFKHLLSDE